MLINSERINRWFGLLPASIAWVVYYLTTCRSIWIGDSGEFALVLKTLGITHPPGYPLFTITGTIVVQVLAFLRPIFAGGIFNLTVAAASVAVVYYIFRRRLNRVTAFGLSLVWAFTPLLWGETAGVEIYTLGVLLISLTFLAVESERKCKWPLTIYLFGLTLTNHPSALALLPALIWLFVREKEYLHWQRLPLYAGLIALAATVYLYLPLRSALDPVSDWSHPATFVTLVDHMTLQQYSGWVGNSLESITLSCSYYFRSVLISWWWLGAFLILSGVVTGLKVCRTRTIIAIIVLVASVIMAAFHQARNYEPFYLPAMLISLILIGNNFIWLAQFQFSRFVRYAASILPIVAVAFMLVINYGEMDRSDYTLAEDYARLILDTAEKGIVFTAGDINSFPTVYLRYGEGYRPEVEVYDRSIRKQAMFGYAAQLARRTFTNYHEARDVILQLAPAKKFLVKNHYQNEPNWLTTSVPLHSYGILYAAGQPATGRAGLYTLPAEYDPGDLMSRQLVAHLDLLAGEEALLGNPPDGVAALRSFRNAVNRMRDEPRAELLNHLGIYFRKVGFLDLALETYEKALTKPLMMSYQKEEILFNISNIHKDRGNAALSEEDYTSAVKHFTNALEYDRNNTTLLLNIALLHIQKLGQPEEARPCLQRYLQVKPDDSRVRNLLGSLK